MHFSNFSGVRGRSKSLFVVAALALGSTLAHADALSIAPSQASFTFASAAVNGTINPGTIGSVTVSTLGSATLVNGVFSAPVESVTVAGQGPGPIHVNFDAAAGVKLSGGVYSLSLSGLAFDVGTKSLTGDLALLVPTPCTAQVCAAVFTTTEYDFNDISLLKASSIAGNIDGGMLLDQALAVPTLLAQKLNLSADMVLDFSAVNAIAAKLGVALPQVALAPVKVGTLTVSPVPEVPTYGLMGLGMLAMGVVMRRRQQG